MHHSKQGRYFFKQRITISKYYFRGSPSGTVFVGGYDGVYLNSVELFPRVDSCSIPDLPEGRGSHTISLLSGGRLVVCGGRNDARTAVGHSCISWVEGNITWTNIFTTRWPPQKNQAKTNWLITGSTDMTTMPGHQMIFLIPLCCLVAVVLVNSMPRLYQVLHSWRYGTFLVSRGHLIPPLNLSLTVNLKYLENKIWASYEAPHVC